MNKVFGIVGALLFVGAVAVGCFCDFKGDVIVQLALSAFALASMIVSIIKKAKDEGTFSWKTVVVIVLAVVGGALCAVGGLQSNIFEAIAGAVVAIISIIFGVFITKKAPAEKAA